MSSTRKQNVSANSYLKALLFLVPVALIMILGAYLMGTANALILLRWSLILDLFGLITYPLACYIFKDSGSGGFFLGKVIGISGVSLIVWTLTYCRIFRFNVVFVIIAAALLAVACYIPKPFTGAMVKRISADGTIERIVCEETVFAIVFVYLCYFKGILPDINGQEKFMDYGFIMSMLRNPSLPAGDMWLSGYSINYYYFGQFMYALIIKVSGIRPSIGYNVAMCSSIAIPFAMSYSIGCYLIETARKNGMKCIKYGEQISGLLTGCAVMLFGNSHSWFYDENSIGNDLLKSWKRFRSFGIDVGRTDGFFYPDSTRYIGYNPDSALIEGIPNGADRTIEEFPFYSYLIGDLHAHVVSTMIVLLIMAICIAFVSRSSSLPLAERLPKSDFSVFTEVKEDMRISYIKHMIASVITPEIIICALLLGCAQMTNYWDFLIYFIFCSMALIVASTLRSEHFANIMGIVSFVAVMAGTLIIYLKCGDRPVIHIALQAVILVLAGFIMIHFPSALSRTSTGMSFLFTVSHIVALPFNLNFDMISNSIAKCVNHSSPFQLFILWGTHVVITVTFFVFTVIFKNYKYSAGKTQDKVVGADRIASYDPNPVRRFLMNRNATDIFVCGMIVTGLIMLIAPEIFYVRDIYTGGYLRANTMFKFTYAGFIILSVAMIYSVIRLFWIVGKNGKYSTVSFFISIFFCFLLFIPAHYTLTALKQRCGDLSRNNFKTLDGTAYTVNYSSQNTGTVESGNLSEYMDAVNWFNTSVPGPHIILESYGESYTDYNIVSAYTGLQTVCGWQTHEWLWRFHGIVDPETDLLVSDPEYDVWDLYLTPRYYDIATVYTDPDPNVVRSVLDKYGVEYVIIGDMERNRFHTDNTDVISALGTVEFSSGDLIVVRIDR